MIGDLEVQEVPGFKFWTRSGSADLSMIWEIVYEDQYRLFRQAPLNGKLIVDAGANIGAFSIVAKKRWPGARIVAYEPDPDNYRLLLLNCEANGVEIETHNVAVWKHGNGGLLLHGAGPLVHVDEEHAGVIPTISMDKVLEEPVGFLKLDIEGAEIPALLSARPESLVNVETFAGEFHADHPDWGAMLRHIGGIFDLEIHAHPYPQSWNGGLFYGYRKACWS